MISNSTLDRISELSKAINDQGKVATPAADSALALLCNNTTITGFDAGDNIVEKIALESDNIVHNSMMDELVGTVDATTAIDTFNEIETFLAGVTNEKTLTGMLAVTDGKAVTAQTTADAAKSTAQTALSKATANETKLNTIPEMPENDGKIYGFCNGAWVVIAEVGKNVYTD
jgi:hypothetical protein